MRSRAHLLLDLYQIAAGLGDTLTGIMLLVAPVLTLHIMHIGAVPTPSAFVSFIGAFVLGVGLTYVWEALRRWRGESSFADWEAQWRCTALLRACVAIFLTVEIATSHLELAWSFVAVWDAALAIFQVIGLNRGWLRSPARNTLG